MPKLDESSNVLEWVCYFYDMNFKMISVSRNLKRDSCLKMSGTVNSFQI